MVWFMVYCGYCNWPGLLKIRNAVLVPGCSPRYPGVNYGITGGGAMMVAMVVAVMVATVGCRTMYCRFLLYLYVRKLI
jgi:hypothetical protein